MKISIETIALKYRNNKLARIFVRPIYEFYLSHKLSKRNKIFRKNALNLLKHFKNTLDSYEIKFWLEFGTLLGAYREHNFITHDCDLDVGVFYKDRLKIYQCLISAGFTFVHEYRTYGDSKLGFEQTFEYLGVTIDIFYFHIDNNQLYCNSYSIFPNSTNEKDGFQVKKIFWNYMGFSKIQFQNMEFDVPAPIENHLIEHYGKNFMIPNPNFDYKKESLNIFYYPKSERVGHIYYKSELS